MSFREKSAWGMGLVTLMTGLLYAFLVGQSMHGPILAAIIPYILLVIVLAVIVQTVLAVLSPAEAMAKADERDRLVIHRAGHIARIVLVIAVLASAATYIALPNGNMLFHHIIGALIVAQLVEYGAQLVLYRGGH